jgi:uncharacterized protein YerC
VFDGLGKIADYQKVTAYEIADILKDYHWMMNSIRLLRESMASAGERIVRAYDIDSDMPKPQGGTSDPVFQEIVRREKRWKNIIEYEEKVTVIQERIHLIKDERELEVLHLLLDGKSYSWIARHMGLSDRHIRRIKDSIVEQMSGMSETPTIS